MFDVAKTSERHLQIDAKVKPQRLRRIAFIGNYSPRRCGIATFTTDSRAALLSADPSLIVDVVALNDPGAEYEYGHDVKHVIRQDELADYGETALQLNDEGVELVCLQHEYGIFGGPAGEHILTLVNALKCPLVTQFHTILERPDADQARVLKELIRRSSRLVVMSEKGREILMRVYGSPARKINVIPHGTPDCPLVDTAGPKADLGLAGRDVLLTFGLLSPGKGLEYVIRAMPEIVAEHPDALYVILGATHPHLVAREGEAYRESLQLLAEELGVAANVRFVNAYVDAGLLVAYLSAADVYVTPYLNEAQITSGTLSQAVALGKAVVSTPYWHAAELLANGVGKLVPFANSKAIASQISALLADNAARQTLRERAYAKGRETIWPIVGQSYLRTYEGARADARLRPARREPVPAPNLRALERMTDACGMLQHARAAVPDRNHGYCVDDNARALMLINRAYDAGVRLPQMERMAYAYAAFVEHAWNDGIGRFRNFMSFDRRWLEEAGSEDSCARAFWAIAETALLSRDEELRRWALQLADRVVPHVTDWTPLRTRAFAALGFAALLEARPSDSRARDGLWHAASAISDAFDAARRPDWVWFEPPLSYDNARISEALLRAGLAFDEKRFRDNGIESLSWLAEMQRAPSGVFRPVGTRSFGRPYELPRPFDQQPLEAAAMVDASWVAFDVSGDPAWVDEAQRAYAWYLGENDLAARVAVPDLGGCYDGLGPGGLNRNQGAESILSFQLATCAMRVRDRARRTKSF